MVLVAHFPRKEVASERVYRTVTATGEITPERELVDVWVDDGTEKSKEKEEKSRGGKEAKEQPGSISISVVVPAYNEFLRLPGMLAEAVTFLTLSYPLGDWEILIVDDGSTDDTAKAALNWTVNYIRVAGEKGIAEGSVRVCKLARNRGKGGAVTHGMKHVRGKYAVFADADGATRFKDLRVLFERVKEVEKGGHGVAVGSRAHMVTTDAVVKVS